MTLSVEGLTQPSILTFYPGRIIKIDDNPPFRLGRRDWKVVQAVAAANGKFVLKAELDQVLSEAGFRRSYTLEEIRRLRGEFTPSSGFSSAIGFGGSDDNPHVWIETQIARAEKTTPASANTGEITQQGIDVVVAADVQSATYKSPAQKDAYLSRYIKQASIALTSPDEKERADAIQSLFDELYTYFEEPIYQHVYRLLGVSEDAQDFTQDAFVKAFRKLPETLAKGSFQPRAWLYRIATNVCLDEFRHRKGIKWQSWENFISVFHPSQIAPDNPEGALMQKETRYEVEEVLGRLSPRYRTALQLREYHGLGYEEISDVMGISREAVKALLLRARESFRLHYNKLLPHEAAQSTGSMVKPRAMRREPKIGAIRST